MKSTTCVTERADLSQKQTYIAYFRVSTAAQGRSGLGIEAQRQTIRAYLKTVQADLLTEYIDIESGARDQRPNLQKAIGHAKSTKATLVIAKLDRVSRKVSFIATLMESGVKFVVADLPNADEFQLHIYAALAQQERKLISERTRAALKAAKQRGILLGEHAKPLHKRNGKIAKDFALNLKNVILPLYDGKNSLRDIARTLNDRKIPTFKGGIWHSVTVSRVLKRLSLDQRVPRITETIIQ